MAENRGRRALGGFLGDIFQPSTARIPVPHIEGNIILIENPSGNIQLTEQPTGNVALVESPTGNVVLDRTL